LLVIKKYGKGTAKNLLYKLMMNALSGKFGQKAHQIVHSILTNLKSPKMVDPKFFSNLTDFSPIYSKNGDECAIFIERLNDHVTSKYPVHLSAQILANSRVHMSHIYRAANSYLDPSRAIYYADTDSMVISSECIPDLIKGNHIGDEIGQLSCDLGGKGIVFSKIVKAIFGASKGPYSIVYLNPMETILKEKIRAKGM
jgi:hypothetical protein